MSERGKGAPFDTIHRYMRHYGVGSVEALRLIKEGYPIPERGTGIKSGRARR